MKYALVLLALVAAATAKVEIPNVGRGELAKELQDFMDLVPTDKIISITIEYMAEDKEFQKVIAYVKSEEFKNLVADVEGMQELRALMDYVYKAGLDSYKLANMINDFVGLPHLEPPSMLSNYKITGGFRGYLDDVEAVLPIDQMQALYKKKLETSKVFSDFINQLKSPNFQNLVNKVYANQKFQNLLEKAKAAGVDLEYIKELLEILFGIKVPSKPFNRY